MAKLSLSKSELWISLELFGIEIIYFMGPWLFLIYLFAAANRSWHLHSFGFNKPEYEVILCFYTLASAVGSAVGVNGGHCVHIYVCICTYIYVRTYTHMCVSMCAIASFYYYDFLICEKSTKSKANGTNGDGMSSLHCPIAALYICLIRRRTRTHSRSREYELLSVRASFFWGSTAASARMHSSFFVCFGDPLTYTRSPGGSSCSLPRPLQPSPHIHAHSRRSPPFHSSGQDCGILRIRLLIYYKPLIVHVGNIMYLKLLFLKIITMQRNSISYQSWRKEVFKISKNGATVYFSKYFYGK